MIVHAHSMWCIKTYKKHIRAICARQLCEAGLLVPKIDLETVWNYFSCNSHLNVCANLSNIMNQNKDPQHRDLLLCFGFLSRELTGFLTAGCWCRLAVVALYLWLVLCAIWTVQSCPKLASVKGQMPYILYIHWIKYASHHCHLTVRLGQHYVHWSLCFNPLQFAKYPVTFHSLLYIMSALLKETMHCSHAKSRKA